mmetsp:Transcript_43153/g.116574  ORF Transcript_43153/g.116574 Transcript_43153/m.116574 type:complete len:390 (+) Transcript_43153:363-1532(+)
MLRVADCGLVGYFMSPSIDELRGSLPECGFFVLSLLLAPAEEPVRRFLRALGVLGALFFGVGPGIVDLAVKWISAHNSLRDLRKLDPATLGSRLLGGDGHDECEEAVLARAWRRLVVHEGLAECLGLTDVGLFVPRHEEVVRHVGIAREGVRVNAGGIRVHVIGLNHALRAEHFRTLVVAVRCLAAHVDERMFAAGVFDDDRSSVVCLSAGKLLDLLVDHACAVREDSLGLLAHEEAGHIEVVDGHVLEDTPAALHVAEWRWSWVARAELGNNRAADLVVGDSLAHTRKVRVKAALQGGHELDVGDLACVDGLDRLRKIRRDRLLAEDVLARRGARLDLISVEARRRADPNSLDVRVVDHLHVVARPIRHVELLRGRLGLADRRVRDDD